MDNTISAIIQGIIQGLTEFLPVSSSGHLSVAQHFMNVEEGSMTLSVVLHLGTLIAVIVAFHKRIWGMIKEFFLSIRDIFKGEFSWHNMNDDRRMMIMVIIATLILVPFVLIKDFFTSVTGDGDIIFEGCAFLFTSLVLFLSDACVKGKKTGKDMKVKDAITVGLFQCVALFPGVSRSGSTISAGLFCGLTRETAAAFSFILGIPAILGSALLEGVDVIKSGEQLDVLPLVIGAAVAAVVGLLAIKLVQIIIKNDKFKIFGIYTLIIGVACISVGIYENVTGTKIFLGM
ncbi:MAG: undecaprenyl-diphosphate phosphatase [Ruminiclostridium sp.]|nr:undecaprenyl-diphosphate phosphatase [Ruminiclostridium sp.]